MKNKTYFVMRMSKKNTLDSCWHQAKNKTKLYPQELLKRNYLRNLNLRKCGILNDNAKKMENKYKTVYVIN